MLATFNGGHFLRAQLDSLAAQTLPPVELIVADDGSSDETIEIVRRFADRAPFPVRLVVNPENVGYGENFLRACSRASSEFIALCDQDDVWRPKKLEIAQAELRATHAGLLVHAAELIDESDRVLGPFTQGIRRKALVPPCRSAPWGVYYGFTMVFRRELLGLLNGARWGQHTFEENRLLSHDHWIYFLATDEREQNRMI